MVVFAGLARPDHCLTLTGRMPHIRDIRGNCAGRMPHIRDNAILPPGRMPHICDMQIAVDISANF